MFDGPNFHHTTCVPAANEALGVQLSTMTRNITVDLIPKKWTTSSYQDGLGGLLFRFELVWREIAKRTVATLCIVEVLDVVSHGL